PLAVGEMQPDCTAVGPQSVVKAAEPGPDGGCRPGMVGAPQPVRVRRWTDLGPGLTGLSTRRRPLLQGIGHPERRHHAHASGEAKMQRCDSSQSTHAGPVSTGFIMTGGTRAEKADLTSGRGRSHAAWRQVLQEPVARGPARLLEAGSHVGLEVAAGENLQLLWFQRLVVCLQGVV